MSDPAPRPEDGQFDDAPQDNNADPIAATATRSSPPDLTRDLRNTDHAFIDEDPGLLAWSDDDNNSEEGEEEDELNEADFDYARVEDEDWEMAERGTPKRSVLVTSTTSNLSLRLH